MPTNKDQFERLKAEAEAPYRGFRKFIYLGLGASGLIGVFIFSLRLLAGYDPTEILPNLALQLGVVALMTWLFRWESSKNQGNNGDN
ncbi:DUF3493 domain-containing protein [Synechocystis sp. B12]|uniref:DUF3493 domain-containing protein n=1 Tax=unclassified Synechocystis TaxID=2640012 RepID=UPI0002A5AF2F|nr:MULTISPECIES: DUF3493 domain-containing protein [unclassified Synechocystis]QHV00245.1 hypothetical protein BWK47_08945 [Synechocystis sp. CACIAM 05]UOO10301.1 DUF3493 domain-containing protein [Synechocystis sp. PCC 6803]WLT38109.1 DUF3493 domain-containing protein [Synechocystis sp. B12]BAM54939.1 hypothetical protein BEST7613_6008 [Synechocystis sp. PCC 6803] [Bacillus subtilis BEST7613]